MAKKDNKLQIAQKDAGESLKRVNEKINELGLFTKELYVSLNNIQTLFDTIRNTPSKQELEYKELREIRSNWKLQAGRIEEEYEKARVKAAGGLGAGVGAGVAVAALGPTAAMGVATSFGVASTGTAIAALHGAAAYNAALAWLGGGALALGGGGMAAGEVFLALFGPVGWAIAGISLVSSGLFLLKGQKDKKRLEDIFCLISYRDKANYDLAVVELEERIVRIKDETRKLIEAAAITKTFGTDYSAMTEMQQYQLGSYVNLMHASTQLLTNPIQYLQPNYDESNYEVYKKIKRIDYSDAQEKLIVYLANILYKIEISPSDEQIIASCFRGNKKFMESFELKKKDVSPQIVHEAVEANIFKEQNNEYLSSAYEDEKNKKASVEGKISKKSLDFIELSGDIATVKADAIVLPANEHLVEGPGASAAIFEAAGRSELTTECKKIGRCKIGSAVPTKAYNLDADYIIHAVVPKWKDGKHKEYELLCSAYLSSLFLADAMRCRTIAFPLLSSGNNGFDFSLAYRIAKHCIESYKSDYLETVYLVLYNKNENNNEPAYKMSREEKDPAIVKRMLEKGKKYLSEHPELINAILDYAEKILKLVKLAHNIISD